MGLQDALRKAAGLLIEQQNERHNAPPSDAQMDALLATAAATSKDLEAALDTPPRPSIDELLAQQGANPRTRAGSAGAGPNAKAAPKTVEQIVRDTAGPNLDEIKLSDASLGKSNSVLKPGEIYQAAKLPATPFSAEQMLDMLGSLPKELPLETRRATVKVTLGALGKSLGATPETIVADASRKMAALGAYNDHLARRTGEFVTREEASILELQKQIEAKKQAIIEAKKSQSQALETSKTESERLDDVLEFFSLDVPPSKYAAGAASAPAGAATSPAAGGAAGGQKA